MDLGLTIKKLRQQNGFNQSQFAEACGITQTYLSQIENNLKEPNISTLRNISNQLSVPLPVLFFLTLDDNDIQEDKRNAFNLLAPSIKSMISEFFSVTPA